MSDAVMTAVVAASGVALGAILTAISAGYSARQKIRELELTYQQKLQESYLTSARQYTKNLYVPLCLALTRLDDEFEEFQEKADLDKSTAPQAAVDQMKAAIDTFRANFERLRADGASAFLTTALDERIRSFSRFLDASITANNPVVRGVVQVSWGLFGVSHTGQFGFTLRGKRTARWGRQRVDLGMVGLGVSYEASEIVAAPLISREFVERFVTDVASMLRLIKEVTLGAAPKG